MHCNTKQFPRELKGKRSLPAVSVFRVQVIVTEVVILFLFLIRDQRAIFIV